MEKIGKKTRSIILMMATGNFILILLLLYLTQCSPLEENIDSSKDSAVLTPKNEEDSLYTDGDQVDAVERFEKLNRSLSAERVELRQQLEGLYKIKEETGQLYSNEAENRNYLEVREGIEFTDEKLDVVNAPEDLEVIPMFKFNEADLRMYSVVFPDKRWKKKELKVFFHDLFDDGLINEIIDVAGEWTKHSGINFRFTPRRFKSDVRIALNTQGHISSEIGTDAAKAENFGEITMHLSGLRKFDEKKRRRIILHEFGHVLGLGHAHQTREVGVLWDVPKAIRYYKTTYGLDSAQIMKQIVDRYAEGQHHPLDPLSIMIYEVPASITKNGRAILRPDNISQRDSEVIFKMYQKE